MLNRSGYNTGNVTIKHSYESVGDLSLLFRSDYSTTPSTDTDITTLATVADTVSVYANTSVVYPITTFPLSENVTTPLHSKFSNVYFADVSSSRGDYRTDESYNALFEITNQTRSTVVGIGLISTTGSTNNLKYATRISQVGGGSFIQPCETCTAFTAYDDTGPHPFSFSIDYTELREDSVGPQIVVNIYGWDGSHIAIPTGSNISTDEAFLDAFLRGNMVLRRLSDNISTANLLFLIPPIGCV